MLLIGVLGMQKLILERIPVARRTFRAIEEKRMTQLRDRSALLADKARQRSDRAAGRKRAEALAVIVVCATRVSSSFCKCKNRLQIVKLPLTTINHTFSC